MNCPNCKKKSLCGCNSCIKNSNGKYPVQRTEKMRNLPEHPSIGLLTCPYCRSKFTSDMLLDYEWKSINKDINSYGK